MQGMIHVRRWHRAACALMVLAVSPVVSFAAGETANDCVGIANDLERLTCYDRAMHRESVAPTAPIAAREADAARREVFARDPAVRTREGEEHPLVASLLDSRWELDESSKQGAFHLRAYKPLYLLPVFYTNDTNQRPTSPAADRTATTSRELQNIEAVYQLSLKTKLWENIFGNNGDLWTGYTQTSHWQIYNGNESRPFSETNYEPELTLAFRTDYNLLGWDGRLLGITVNHQSNGQSKPLSRSWNRTMLNLGFERDGWALILRPWWRIHDSSDDNPDISDYMGRGDLTLVHVWNGQEISLMARHSLRSGDRSHGALQFDWAVPISGDLRAHLQLFDGYGQSLIDYNHKAWYVGVGLSLLEWY